MSPLSGKPQTPEHIARRVAAIAVTKATWTEERREVWKLRISANTASRRPEVRAKNSASHKGQFPWNKSKTCPQLSGDKHWNWGGKQTPESIEKIRIANTGKKQTPEWIAKRVVGRAGYQHSAESKERIRQTNLKTYSDPEIRAKHIGPNASNWGGGPVTIPCTCCGNAVKRARSVAEKAKSGCFCNRQCYNEWLAFRWESPDYRAAHSGRNAVNYVSGTWSDPILRQINNRIASNMSHSLKGAKAGYAWESLVGYTVHDLQKKLERTIPSGYSWDDFLAGRLHIDHEIPKAAFNFRSPSDLDFHRCWSLKNLRLLPAIENMRKGAKLSAPFQPSLALGLATYLTGE